MRNFHKFKSMEETLKRIREVRKTNRFVGLQLVVIDYTNKPSKIVLVNNG